MTFSLLWLPKVLRDAGLQVFEVPGWQNRGHGDEGEVLGILCHHTCGPLHGEMADLSVIVDGRPDLGGPLAQLALGRTGIFHIVAAGKCWHAGRGMWQGITDGNAHFIGIEAENTGETTGPRAEPWSDAIMDAYRRGCAAILKHIGAKPIMCAGHKEFALPKGRKDDPSFDMMKFRADVAALMNLPHGPMSAPSPSLTHSRIGTVNTSGLNVRSAASAASKSLGTLPKGKVITIQGQTGEWYQIDTGFVAARYVDLT